MRNKHQIPADTICYIEEKVHGTSHRTGHVEMNVWNESSWWYKLLYKLANGFKKIPHVTKWIYINGTRRVIHTPKNMLDKKFFHDNTMREEVLEEASGLLHKGEEIYLELFGHEKGGGFIQKGFPYGTNPDAKIPYRTLLYRVTMNNVDGITVDYSREAVYKKADELAMEKPYLFEKFYYSGTYYSMRQLETAVIEYAQGQSELAEDTLKEGVVVWFINARGDWTALKYKSDKFRLKESGQKDKGVVDPEDNN